MSTMSPKHTIRPGMRRPRVLIPAAPLIIGWIAVVVFRPGAALFLFGCLVLVFLMPGAWRS